MRQLLRQARYGIILVVLSVAFDGIKIISIFAAIIALACGVIGWVIHTVSIPSLLFVGIFIVFLLSWAGRRVCETLIKQYNSEPKISEPIHIPANSNKPVLKQIFGNRKAKQLFHGAYFKAIGKWRTVNWFVLDEILPTVDIQEQCLVAARQRKSFIMPQTWDEKGRTSYLFFCMMERIPEGFPSPAVVNYPPFRMIVVYDKIKNEILIPKCIIDCEEAFKMPVDMYYYSIKVLKRILDI